MSVFEEFIGKNVKASYDDNGSFKLARGTLEEISGGFIKIRGPPGVLILNEKDIKKMGLLKE